MATSCSGHSFPSRAWLCTLNRPPSPPTNTHPPHSFLWRVLVLPYLARYEAIVVPEKKRAQHVLLFVLFSLMVPNLFLLDPPADEFSYSKPRTIDVTWTALTT